MNKIKLVANDTGPELRVVIFEDPSGLTLDLAGATALLKFRAVGTDTVLFQKTGWINAGPGGDAVDGVVYFRWDTGDLDLPAGDYEGEIELTMPDGVVQTVFDPLQFRLRSDF